MISFPRRKLQFRSQCKQKAAMLILICNSLRPHIICNTYAKPGEPMQAFSAGSCGSLIGLLKIGMQKLPRPRIPTR